MVKKQKPSSTPAIPEGQFELAEFKGKTIRKVLHSGEWYFSIIDVVEAATDSPQPSRYWNELKAKLVNNEGFDELFGITEKLNMLSADGKNRPTDAANTETMFRIIQSIPSKKAELFKRWLAKVGYERILEAQNPDIAIKRAILDYKLKGRDEEWIEARISTTLTRLGLAKEWSKRGIRDQQYAILTNLIHEETFDLSVKGHEAIKSLKKHHNLRDHMTSPELLFTRLGEMTTKSIAIDRDAHGFQQNQFAAREGGKVAGNARRDFELQTGQKVVSSSNFLPAPKASRGLLGN